MALRVSYCGDLVKVLQLLSSLYSHGMSNDLPQSYTLADGYHSAKKSRLSTGLGGYQSAEDSALYSDEASDDAGAHTIEWADQAFRYLRDEIGMSKKFGSRLKVIPVFLGHDEQDDDVPLGLG